MVVEVERVDREEQGRGRAHLVFERKRKDIGRFEKS
jgi:predicted ArsR family transcriptional regulator